MTTNHEMAHQMVTQVKVNATLLVFGFCKNDDLHIQYSGYSMVYGIV
jgi:hypothetical protein